MVVGPRPALYRRPSAPGPSASQVEVTGDLTDRAVATLTHLDDLVLELIGERTARVRLLVVPHAHHDEHPSEAEAPDLGCPFLSPRAAPQNRC